MFKALPRDIYFNRKVRRRIDIDINFITAADARLAGSVIALISLQPLSNILTTPGGASKTGDGDVASFRVGVNQSTQQLSRSFMQAGWRHNFQSPLVISQTIMLLFQIPQQ